MANPWFRMYAEFANDPKVQMMSEVDQRRFVMLLCMRCSNDHVTLQDNEVAFQLRITEDEWAQTKARFLAKRLIDEDNLPAAWDKRQFTSDSSAERVRKHRERKKQEAKHQRNVTVTPPDTDTDTDKEAAASSTEETPALERKAESPPPSDPENPPPTPDEAPARATQIAVLLRRNGADARTHPASKGIADLVAMDATDAQVLTALETAKQRRKEAGSAQPVTAAYLVPIVRESQSPPPDTPAPQEQDRWWTSNAGIDRKARELGMFARGNEDYPSFKDRIFDEIRRRKSVDEEAAA